MLQRKFESPDGSSIHWQTVIPKAVREDFLQHIHGGMTGGHLGREKTAAQIKNAEHIGHLGLETWISSSEDANPLLGITEARTLKRLIFKHL